MRALVLYEFLSRFMENKGLIIQDQAEERVLWDLQCDLERILKEPLLSNDRALLEAAREEPKRRVRAKVTTAECLWESMRYVHHTMSS